MDLPLALGCRCSTEVAAGVEATKPADRVARPLGPGMADVSIKLFWTSLLLLSPKKTTKKVFS